MLVPVLVFLVCFGAGIVISARWLPELGAGPVGGVAFFATCGLLAAALGVAGLHGYLTVNEIRHSVGPGVSKAEVLAGGLQSILFDSGTIAALAGILYLLAPGPDEAAFAPSDIEPSGPEA